LSDVKPGDLPERCLQLLNAREKAFRPHREFFSKNPVASLPLSRGGRVTGFWLLGFKFGVRRQAQHDTALDYLIESRFQANPKRRRRGALPTYFKLLRLRC